MTIQIQNVLTRKKVPLETVHDGEVRVYVCGVTVYGRCHVGHLRCYLSFDAILKYLRYRGYNVKYVRNFTDIDDKIIARANEIKAGPDGDWKKGEAYQNYDSCQWDERTQEDQKILQMAQDDDRHLAEVVSDYFIQVFTHEDFGPFDLMPPTHEPRVSEHIPQVVELIHQIINRGFAYEVAGDVYFDVAAYHEATGAYGKLSGRDYTQLVEGARVAPSDKKRAGPDFALWKASKPGEPAWESPWGPGRPGWHIECSAMSADKLGQPFDIHGGGKDLIFPHHENEIAQSEAATGHPFCNIWMHNGFVTVDGVKMSKSLGNYISIKDALNLAPPEVWRLLILSTHYTNPIDFTRSREAVDEGCSPVRGNIEIAFERLEYFYETLQKSDDLLVGAGDQVGEDPIGDLVKTDIKELFQKTMDDDFNTARALADVGETMRLINELCDMKAKRIKKLNGGRAAWLATIQAVTKDVREVCEVLGLCTRPPDEALKSFRDFSVKCNCLDEALIEKKIEERDRAREEKNWARADEVRQELSEMGVELRDSPNGTMWKIVR